MTKPSTGQKALLISSAVMGVVGGLIGPEFHSVVTLWFMALFSYGAYQLIRHGWRAMGFPVGLLIIPAMAAPSLFAGPANSAGFLWFCIFVAKHAISFGIRLFLRGRGAAPSVMPVSIVTPFAPRRTAQDILGEFGLN